MLHRQTIDDASQASVPSFVATVLRLRQSDTAAVDDLFLKYDSLRMKIVGGKPSYCAGVTPDKVQLLAFERKDAFTRRKKQDINIARNCDKNGEKNRNHGKLAKKSTCLPRREDKEPIT